MKKQSKIAAFAAVSLVSGWCCAASAQPAAPGPFTQDQVDDGRQNFMDNCAECHKQDLSGDAGPTLAGKTFSAKWSKQTTASLFHFIQGSMPPCTAGTLSDNAYADIVAFLLWANGGKPGPQGLEPGTNVAIGSIVTGTARPELASTK